MPKAQPLCAGTELSLGDRALGEGEKNSFIALPGKGGHSGLVPLKTHVSLLGGSGKEFCSNRSKVGLLIRLGCVQGLCCFNLVSGDLLKSFSGSF